MLRIEQTHMLMRLRFWASVFEPARVLGGSGG